jgi:hypothetical protein
LQRRGLCGTIGQRNGLRRPAAPTGDDHLDLRCFLESEPITARRVGALERADQAKSEKQ